MTLEPQQASELLTEIDAIGRRVRQSLLYHNASAFLMLWGAITGLGYSLTALAPAQAATGWLLLGGVGLAGSIAVGAISRRRAGVNTFDYRSALAFLLFVSFGLVWSVGIAGFTPRQLGAFWPSYFMLPYVLVGLWLGRAFVVIGLGVIGLTLAGYLLAGAWFAPWMAVVNGGGLLLGGWWMRQA